MYLSKIAWVKVQSKIFKYQVFVLVLTVLVLVQSLLDGSTFDTVTQKHCLEDVPMHAQLVE